MDVIIKRKLQPPAANWAFWRSIPVRFRQDWCTKQASSKSMVECGGGVDGDVAYMTVGKGRSDKSWMSRNGRHTYNTSQAKPQATPRPPATANSNSAKGRKPFCQATRLTLTIMMRKVCLPTRFCLHTIERKVRDLQTLAVGIFQIFSAQPKDEGEAILADVNMCRDRHHDLDFGQNIGRNAGFA
ncbi:hypothetical protein K438DRAFT_1780137 [Mycena galopus ATCC 62051]|nr:hypothetical protein K438DRAFT_1780137 [Mycena galopus ATCC 62051]